MEPLPRSIRALSGLVLALCAAAGLYLGGSKAFSEGSTGYSAADSRGEPIAAAKAIAPPPPPTFDEAAIRRIAKEEAQGLVAKAAPSPAPRRRSAPAADRQFTTPSEAGLVYARPPGAAESGGAASPPSPPAQVEQF